MPPLPAEIQGRFIVCNRCIVIDRHVGSFYTSLQLAAWFGHAAVIDVLLLYNLDIDAETQYRFTALQLAARKGHVDAVEALLKHKFQVNHGLDSQSKRSESLFTPLQLASRLGDTAILEMLL